jgi:hypothetical protein
MSQFFTTTKDYLVVMEIPALIRVWVEAVFKATSIHEPGTSALSQSPLQTR